jgi:hypothetical protein
MMDKCVDNKITGAYHPSFRAPDPAGIVRFAGAVKHLEAEASGREQDAFVEQQIRHQKRFQAIGVIEVAMREDRGMHWRLGIFAQLRG